MELNPAHIVAVGDCSFYTLRNIIALLEISTEFEHLVYREAELDAVWSMSGFLLSSDPAPPNREALARLHEASHAAHDLVAARRPRDAAQLLRGLL